MTDWSDNAKIVLEQRYLKRNKKGNILESPDEMLERVAVCVSLAEKKKSQGYWKSEFLKIMQTLEFLPNSPALINAGRELGQLAACFVLPLEDDIGHIFEMVKQSALIHKTGGGTGFNFSPLRPSGAIVGSTKGIASGPVSFMRAFDVVTDIIKQGGVRRGANMGILDVTHPDIMDFIECKEDNSKFTNFNLSVGLNGGFLSMVEDDEYIQLHYWGFPYKEKIKAGDILNKICEKAWLNGEPGVLFFDTINKYNPTPWLGFMSATNPCGEMPLLPYESCNLGSINLSKFIKGSGINWKRLEYVVKVAVRLLDDMIDVNNYPRIQIARKSKLTRKVGLGIMGWADLLGELKIPYDSNEALELAGEVMKAIQNVAHKESTIIGREKGYCFRKLRRRNSSLTTIAPTGTLSIIANCSSGIEPHFSRAYTKEVINGTILSFEIPYDTKISTEISPDWHVKTQAVFQKYVDNAVSKTINLPHEASVEDIKNSILLGYDLGCKGMTFYRQGTREAPLQALTECNDDRCLV